MSISGKQEVTASVNEMFFSVRDLPIEPQTPYEVQNKKKLFHLPMSTASVSNF